MVQKLSPPQKQDTDKPPFWKWLYLLWQRSTQPGQITVDQLSSQGGDANQIIKVNAGTSAFEFATLSGTAPINVSFGTGSVAIVHSTSGVIAGTYGGASIIPQFAVNTTGHVTAVNTFGLTGTSVAGADLNVTSPIIFGTGTGTNVLLRSALLAHATSGVVTGTYGGASVIPQIGVTTHGHVNVVNTFGLTGTAVAGADISLTSPIIFSSGTGTNAVLRAVAIAHGTSGIVPGTFGSASVIPQVVVNTYGHVTAVNTLNVAIGGTAVTGADLTLTSPIIYSSGTGTNILLRAASIAHATSGIVPGTFGAVNIIPQVVVNTYGHVTAVNTFGLTGTAVSGADITLTSPIIFASGTGTNAVLRAVSIAHGTSGAIPGTYGGTAGLLQIVVNTYGHVTSAVGTAAFPSTDLDNLIDGVTQTMAANKSRVYANQLTITDDGQLIVPATSSVAIAG